MEIPLALESAKIPLIMLLTCKKIPKSKICKGIQPKAWNKMRKTKNIVLFKDESNVHLPLQGGNL